MAPKDTVDRRLFHRPTLTSVLALIAAERAFLVWKPMPRGKRMEKIPVDPEAGHPSPQNNSARERGVLTLEEALDAAERLGPGFGVGFVPGNCRSVSVVGFDFDTALLKTAGADGERPVRESLARTFGTPPEIYLEVSPSGEGLRGIALGRVECNDIGNGREIGSVGLYWAETKFLTITGNHWGGSPLSLEDGAGAIGRALSRMRELAAAQDSDGTLLPYRGDRDVERAMEHVRSGVALHEPLMWLGAHWARATNMKDFEMVAALEALMEESAAKTQEPGRWQQRHSQIPRWSQNAVRKYGNAWQNLPGHLTMEMATSKLRQLVLQLKSEAANHNQPAPVSIWKRMEQERRAEELPADYTADEVPGGLEAVVRFYDEDERRVWRLRTEGLGVDRVEQADWSWAIEDMPSLWGRELARNAVARMAWDLPGVAALSALQAVSTAAGGNYAVRGTRLTGLNLYGCAIAPTGTGKDEVYLASSEAADVVGLAEGSRLVSEGGLHGALARSRSGDAGMNVAPGQFLGLDEFGILISELAADKTTTLAGAMKLALTLYARSMGKLAAATYSNEKNSRPRLTNPYLVVLGVTTWHEFVVGLTMRMVANGFLNRFICPIETDERLLVEKPVHYVYPDGLPEGAREFFTCVYTAGSELFRLRVAKEGRWSCDPVTQYAINKGGRRVRLIHLDPAQAARIMQTQRDTREWIRRNAERSDLSELAKRVAENTIRVAGCLALGNLDPMLDNDVAEIRISEAQVDYAIRYVDTAVRQLALHMGTMDLVGGQISAARRLVVNRLNDVVGGKMPSDPRARERWGHINAQLCTTRAQLTSWLRGYPPGVKLEVLNELQAEGIIAAEGEVGSVSSVVLRFPEYAGKPGFEPELFRVG